MRKALEVLLAAAVVGLGVFVVRRWAAPRDMAAGLDPSAPPGTDAPRGPGGDGAPSRSVTQLPPIKLSVPPKPFRRPAIAPPPPSR